jgi:shikimate kinase
MKMAERGQPVLLWGMMGAGKSAVAREIQSRTSLNVVDLDDLIHAQHGQSPSHIINTFGVSAFREIEAATLRALLQEGCVDIVSLGGGCLLDSELRREIRTRATVCSLFADASVLAARLQGNVVGRPLLEGETDLESRLIELVNERRDAYLDVDFVIDNSDLSVGEVVSSLLRMHEIREAA